MCIKFESLILFFNLAGFFSVTDSRLCAGSGRNLKTSVCTELEVLAGWSDCTNEGASFSEWGAIKNFFMLSGRN